jgi:hypothetical protein
VRAQAGSGHGNRLGARAPGGRFLWPTIKRRVGLVLGAVPGLVYLLAHLFADTAPGVSLAIYAGLPLLYFLSITVLRGSRQRNRE